MNNAPKTIEIYPEFRGENLKQLFLNKNPQLMVAEIIKRLLNNKKFRRLNFEMIGMLVLLASKSLLTRTQKELMEPLGLLFNIMENVETETFNEGRDWTVLKRKQRARILRDHWEKIRRHKAHMRNIVQHYPRARTYDIKTEIHNTEVISQFCMPFSATANNNREFASELREIMQAGIKHELPWQQILAQQIINGTSTFNELSPIISDHKRDRAIKFQTLLEMANAGQIDIVQEKNFGDIHFNPPLNKTPKTDLAIKDPQGCIYQLDWHTLQPKQRDKVIADLRNKRIMMISNPTGEQHTL